MMQKIFTVLILLSLTIFSVGCWDRQELSELAMVMSTGVDLAEDNRLLLTVQLARPADLATGVEGGIRKGTPTWVVSAKGETIFDAQTNLAKKVSRNIYWGHNITLVIGEKLARSQGTRMITNYFQRANEPRATMWVMVARGEAGDILAIPPELEKSSAQETGFLIKRKRGISVNLKDFAEMLASKGTNPVVARVEVVSPRESVGGSGNEQSSKKTVGITGAAVFKEDKMVGWLNDSQTKGLLWLKGQIEREAIIIPSPGESDKKISVSVFSESVKIEPEYDGENIWFNVNINVKGDMLEQQGEENLVGREKKKAMEDEVAGFIQARCAEVVDKVQNEYGTDIFGFGDAFHRNYKRVWHTIEDRWNEEFTRAGVNITVKADIHGLGLSTRRASVPASVK